MVVRPSKGGAFGHAARLGKELTRLGYECAICGPHAHLESELGLEVFDIDIPRRPHLRRHPAAVRDLGRVYRRFAPDVVHAHGSQGGVVARLARAYRPGTPVIFTPHNYAFTNYFTSALERGAFRAIETGLAPLAKRVLCVCLAEQAVAARVGPSSRTRVVYNGIEPLVPTSPSPEITSLAAAGPLICTVAELQPPKGVTTLVAAMPKVIESFPSANLVVAGEGAERGPLERQISDLGIGGHVILLGSVDEVAGLLSAADVFVQPGWSESFPYSLLEAMSLSLPIVATDVGGMGEAISDSETGRLVPTKDADAMASAIVSLLRSPDEAKVFGRAARERMMSQFRFDQMVSGTLAVYHEVGLP